MTVANRDHTDYVICLRCEAVVDDDADGNRVACAHTYETALDRSGLSPTETYRICHRAIEEALQTETDTRRRGALIDHLARLTATIATHDEIESSIILDADPDTHTAAVVDLHREDAESDAESSEVTSEDSDDDATTSELEVEAGAGAGRPTDD